MEIKFNVLHVDHGVISSEKPIPEYFHKIAKDCYSATRSRRENTTEERIKEMVGVCIRLLDQEAQEYSPPTSTTPNHVSKLDRDSYDEIGALNHLLCGFDHDTGKFTWSSFIAGGDQLKPAHLMAAYVFMLIDRAAEAYLMGHMESALQATAAACLATADYGFHGGFEDRGDMLKEASVSGSQKRWEPQSEVKAFVLSKWAKGGWKSKRQCSIALISEVVSLAESKGWRMSAGNAQRTIYDWLRSVEE